MLARNPLDLVEAPRIDTERKQMWSSEQLADFKAVAEQDRLRALWITALELGMRRGELCGLRWVDVELDSDPPRFEIRHTITRVGGKPIKGAPKTEAGARLIVLGPLLVDVLRKHREDMLDESVVRYHPGLPEYVFVDELGQPYNPDNLLYKFHRLCEVARVPRLTLHSLRHTANTLAMEAGVPLKVQSSRMGHSRVNITADIYSHASLEEQRRAAAAVEERLAGVGSGPSTHVTATRDDRLLEAATAYVEGRLPLEGYLAILRAAGEAAA
jgi:integrase